jgi:hypothetical protein
VVSLLRPILQDIVEGKIVAELEPHRWHVRTTAMEERRFSAPSVVVPRRGERVTDLRQTRLTGATRER